MGKREGGGGSAPPFFPPSRSPTLLNSCEREKTETYNPGQKSLGQYCNIHIFLSFLGSLLKRCSLLENFLLFSLTLPYTNLKLEKNSGYTRPTLFVE